MSDAPMCRLPAYNSQPQDELFHAIKLLTVAARSLEAAPSSSDILHVLDVVLQTLRPIGDYLDAIEVEGGLKIFQKCRIEAMR